MDRREFLRIGSASAAAILSGLAPDVKAEEASSQTLRVRFLGTGAADWNGIDERGEVRRLSSILLDSSILIDFTETSFDMIPRGCKPETVFYTHSHDDHYRPEAALRLGVKKVFLGETWFGRGLSDFKAASGKLGLPMPEVIPVTVGERYTEGGITFTPLPANHVTSDLKEQTLIYLVEKGDTRLLYATDTGGIMGLAARIAGIDAHKKGTAITALIMEATMGLGHEDDFRIYSHSSVDTVARTVRVLLSTGRYAPAEGRKVYLTHLARTLHGTQAQLDATLPDPLKAAYDGLELQL